MDEFLHLPPVLAIALMALLGLLLGSFLNVVIYRLPLVLQAGWRAECADMAGQTVPATEVFNLMTPGSRCQSCKHALSWYENVPLVSYLLLGGKCRHCKSPVSWRYPLIELVTGALFGFCAWRWGLSASALAWSGFASALICLGLIDWDTTLLPDDITLPLVWAGLIAAALGWTAIDLSVALWGAVAGYLSLWLIYQAFKFATDKEGMGFGDFKLFAALGAWFGWPALLPIILLASIIGALMGLVMKFAGTLRQGGYIPFGPFLVGAGFVAMIFGPQTILQAIGF